MKPSLTGVAPSLLKALPMITRAMSIVFCTSVGLAACGGNAMLTSDGSGGGTVSGTTGSGGGIVSATTGSGTTSTTTSSGQGGGLPSECSVESPEEGPYPATLRMLNNGAETVYLAFKNCSSPQTVTACADGYEEPLALWPRCTTDCDLAPNDCVECDLACPEGPIAVAPGEAYEEPWTGYTYQFDLNAAGCNCHRQHIAPAARYRITVPVYATEQDAWDGNESAVRDMEFELTSAHQDVVINL